jgi:hypothetical protein
MSRNSPPKPRSCTRWLKACSEFGSDIFGSAGASDACIQRHGCGSSFSNGSLIGKGAASPNLAGTIDKRKTPALVRRAFEMDNYSSWRSEADGSPGNPADVGASDTEVLKFAAGHAAEFVDCLTELDPVVKGACNVHDNPLSKALTLATLLGSGVVSMSVI